jgi:hypothetical protein
MMRKITQSQELNLQEKNTKTSKVVVILSVSFILNPVHYCRCKGIGSNRSFCLPLSTKFYIHLHSKYRVLYGPHNSVITILHQTLHIIDVQELQKFINYYVVRNKKKLKSRINFQ